jgi:hypothetical protein
MNPMLKKITLTLLLTIFSFSLSGCILTPPSRAGIEIEASPQADVYINDQKVGQTPYEDMTLEGGRYTIRLVADDLEYEKKIDIEPGTVYYINRELSNQPNQEAGEIVYLENGVTGIGIISTPTSANITLDGQDKGETPSSIQDISQGDHEIVIAKPGYESRVIPIKIVDGKRVIVEAQLKDTRSIVANPDTADADSTNTDDSQSPDEQPSPDPDSQPTDTPATPAPADPTPTPDPTAAPDSDPDSSSDDSNDPPAAIGKVTIDDTSTGWLRVRNKPGLVGEEIAKLDSGTEVDYVQQMDNGWTEIILENGDVGYVASRFVTVQQ